MGNSDTEFARPRLLEGDLRRRKQADWQAGRQAGRRTWLGLEPNLALAHINRAPTPRPARRLEQTQPQLQPQPQTLTRPPTQLSRTTDINECEIPSLAALCSDNSECCNLPGHFVCKCKPGYQQLGQDQSSLTGKLALQVVGDTLFAR